MNSKKKNLIIALSVGLLLAMIFVSFFWPGENNSNSNLNIESVETVKDGERMRVYQDGRVVYQSEDGAYEDFWSMEKTDAYFAYFAKNYAQNESGNTDFGQNTISLKIDGEVYTYSLQEDELISAAQDDATIPDNQQEGSGGDNTSQYFEDSQDNSSDTDGGGGSTDSSSQDNNDQGTSSGGSSSGGWSDECLFWRLSYCVIPRTPTPTQMPTSQEVEVKEPDCQDNLETGRTVITNELCLPTPTPSPTP